MTFDNLWSRQDPETTGETGEPEGGGAEGAGGAHQDPQGQARAKKGGKFKFHGWPWHGLLEALDGTGDTAPRGEAVRPRRRVGLHRGQDLKPGTDSLVKFIEFDRIQPDLALN